MQTTETAKISIAFPSFLYKTVHIAIAVQGITIKEACHRLICGLPGLTDAELKSLPEPPPHGKRARRLQLDLDYKDVDVLSETSRLLGLTGSAVLCRLFYAVLHTGQIRFIPCDVEGDFQLQLVQRSFEFN
jgi:hypothetical protein